MNDQVQELLDAFPSPPHVAGFCRPDRGEHTCRYLVHTANGYRCAKNNLSRGEIDRKVAQGIAVGGDNCDGVVGQVYGLQALLRNRKVSHTDTSRSVETVGILEVMDMKNGTLRIWMRRGNGSGMKEISLPIATLQIQVNSGNIAFVSIGSPCSVTVINASQL